MMASDTKELALAYVDDAQSQVLVASTIFYQTSNPDRESRAGLDWGEEAEIIRSSSHAGG